MLQNTSSLWFSAVPEKDKLNLICLPQAGGDTSLYYRWADQLGPQVHVMPARLPGRGMRKHEPVIERMEELVAQLAQVLSEFQDAPFALLGSSMGGWIAYELALQLDRIKAPEPTALFILAAASPFAPRKLPVLEDCSESELIEELTVFNPAFAEIAEHDDLVKLLIPAILGDFKLCENYSPRVQWQVPMPIFAVAGLQDELIARYKVEGWRKLSSHSVSISEVEGGHQFIESRPESVIKLIRAHADLILTEDCEDQ